MQVRELFGCSGPIAPVRGDSEFLISDDISVGIEVETEGCGLSKGNLNSSLQFWDVIKDGSLKSHSPWEFVFKAPMHGATIEAALDELEGVLDKTPVTYPHNTSVHVHVDISSLSTEELRSFLYLAITLESALIQVSGNRRNNVFCMPLGGSSGNILRDIGKSIDSSKCHVPTDPSMLSQVAKYAAVNFAPVVGLGTLEFRTHTGTHNKREIIDWLNVLFALREHAIMSVNNGVAMDVLDYSVTQDSLSEYLMRVWPRDVVHKMLEHKELYRDVRRSAFIARLALFPKDHNEFEAWASGMAPKKTATPELFASMYGAKLKHKMWTSPVTSTSNIVAEDDLTDEEF